VDTMTIGEPLCFLCDSATINNNAFK